MRAHFIDVGQGDATLLEFPCAAVLIDTGGEQNGEFDHLPGRGKPIPGRGEPYDEDWWIKSYLRREGMGGAAGLPPSLRLWREPSRGESTQD